MQEAGIPSMTDIINLDDHRPKPVLDLTKHDPATPTAPREVLEGVVIPPTGTNTSAGPAAPLWLRSGRAAYRAATHDRTKNGARLAFRHSAYVAGGARIIAKRTWDGRTVARHERMMRSAEAAGQHEVALEWEERAAKFREQRHKRRMELISAPQRVVKGAAFGTAGAAGALLGLGTLLAIAESDPSQVIAPVMFTIDAIRWAVIIVSIVWGPAVFLAPWLAFLGLWNTGRRGQAAPQWALPGGGPDKRDVVPDEGAILDALRNLSVPALNKAFKDGWQPRWVSPTVRLGNGYHTRLQLPMGVTVEMVNDRKKILAHNLLRLPVEVWPTEPRDQPGVMDLWVADQGSLSGAVPPWPLLTDGTADYFKGVPVGVSQRGEPVFGKLMAANYMIGGIMGILGAAGVVFFAFIGFDAVSTAAQETVNPKRDMPIGILGSLAICTVLYILFSHVLTGIAPVEDFRAAGREASVAYAITHHMPGYGWLAKLVTVAILAGFSSVILVMLMGQSRVFFSMSRDGLVPKVFSEVHPKYRTPWKSNLLFLPKGWGT